MIPYLALDRHQGYYCRVLGGVKIFFTTRRFDMAFGPSTDALSVKKRRLAAYRSMGVDEGVVVCPSQVHSANLAPVTKKFAGAGSLKRASRLDQVDGLLTAERGLALAVLTADCLPALFYSPAQRVVCAVHAGWRGVRQGILERCVELCSKKFGVSSGGLRVFFGPCLKSCCYEVGQEFFEFFPRQTRRTKNGFYFDLAAAASAALIGAGVAERFIFDSRMCTSCMGHDFFSYRREKNKAGRGMALIQMD